MHFGGSTGSTIPPNGSDGHTQVNFVRWQEDSPGYWIARADNGTVYKCWEQDNVSEDAKRAWGKCRQVTILTRTDEGDLVRCIPREDMFYVPPDGFCTQGAY